MTSLNKKAPIAALLVGGPPSDKESSLSDDADDDKPLDVMSVSKRAAVKGLLKAFASNDVDAAERNLHAYLIACGAVDDDSDEDDDKESEY